MNTNHPLELMNTTRAILMAVGVVTVLVGAYLLYFEANLDRWVSIGIVTAGILLFVGVCVMMFAGGAKTDPASNNTRGSTVVQENRPVTQRNQRHDPQ